MSKHPTTPQDLARIMRHRAVNVAPLGDLTAINRYADWLDEMPGKPKLLRQVESPGRLESRLVVPRQRVGLP